MSKQEQGGSSSFFTASTERAVATSIVMEMTHPFGCIDKHLFELNSKLKMSSGNLPSVFVR